MALVTSEGFEGGFEVLVRELLGSESFGATIGGKLIAT